MTAAPAESEGEETRLPFDVRLVPSAVAAWGVTMIGILFGQVVAVSICTATLFLAVVGFACARRLTGTARGVLGGLAAFLIVTGCYAGAAGLHVFSVERSPVHDAAARGAWITASVTIRSDPKALRSGGPDMVTIRADIERADIGGIPVEVGGRVLVIAHSEGWATVLPGQSVVLRGQASMPDRSDLTAAVIDARGPPLYVEDPGVIDMAAGAVRTELSSAAHDSLPSARAGLLPGLVVGDVSTLDPDIEDDFRAAGLTHLTAVSGANFSILLGAVLLMVRFVGIGPWWAAALCAVVIVVFVVVARPSPSVLRAAVMGSIGLLALVTGRRKQAVPALCTAVLVLLIRYPELAVDFGFALSVIATAGLVLLSPVWVDLLRARGWRRAPAEIVAVAGAAHAVTAPVIAAMTGTFSMIGIAANVLVAPVVAPITVVGALATITAPLSSRLAEWLLLLASAPLWWLIAVAQWAASAPSASITLPGGLLGACVVTAGMCACALALRWAFFGWIAGAVCLWLSAGWLWHLLA